MRAFKNLAIGAKLAVTFGLVLVMTLIVGIVGFVSTSKLAAGGDRLANLSVPGLAAVADMEAFSRDLRVRIMRIGIARDQKSVANEKQKLAEVRAEWSQAVEDYKATLHGAEEKVILDKVLESRKVQAGYEDQILSLAEAGKYVEAQKVLDNESRLQFRDSFVDTLTQLVHWAEKDSAANGKAMAAVAATAKTSVIIFTLLALTVGVLGAITLTRSVLPPVAALSDRLTKLNTVCLSGLVDGLKAMEQGDLTVDVEPSNRQR